MVARPLTSPADQPNTINDNGPRQADQHNGRGFFTAPGRRVSGALVRENPDTFMDHWTQPRLFYNSLTAAEQQLMVDAIRFETSNVESEEIRKNVVAQLNKVSHELAQRVAPAIGIEVPEPDAQYYHDNTTKGYTIMGEKLKSVVGLKVGVLASVDDEGSLQQAAELKKQLAEDKVDVVVVGERVAEGVDATYSATRAHAFDGVVVAQGAEKLFDPKNKSPLYPNGRPAQTLADAYRWGKPVAALGPASQVYELAGVEDGPGVYAVNGTSDAAGKMKEGLTQFRFADRFPLDEEAKSE